MALRLATIPTLLSALLCVILERYTASNKRGLGSTSLYKPLLHFSPSHYSSAPPTPTLTACHTHSVGFVDREGLRFWFLGQRELDTCDSLPDGWGHCK